MKKVICMLLLEALALSFCACAGEDSESGISVESVASDVSSETDTRLAKLQTENEECKRKNVSLQEELDRLNCQNKTLQSELDALQLRGVAFENIEKYVWVDPSYRLIMVRNEDRHHEIYCYKVESAKAPQLIMSRYCWNIDVSPNGKRVLFNDFESEGGGCVYLYNVGENAAQAIDFTGILKENVFAHFVGWLDDRYFLFTQGPDYPSYYGGNIYLYDTQTNTARELIETESMYVQFHRFDVYNRNESWQELSVAQEQTVFFEIAILNENAELSEYRYAVLPVSDIRDAIEKGKTLTIKTKDTF